MPLTFSNLISPRANHRFSPRSPTSPQKLYFPPGGHTHDRHNIPPDRLHISLSDPVLVAAEERLSGLSPNQNRPLVTNKTASPIRPAPPRFSITGVLSQRSGDDSDGHIQALDPLTITSTKETSSGHFLRARFHGVAATQDSSLLDSTVDSCDIVEVMEIEIPPDDAASENSRHLAPLASETFKEELYIRGYLKRPVSRTINVVPRNFKLMTRKIFPKVLGRRQGRKIAESLKAKAQQGAAKTLFGPNAHPSENHLSTVASVTLRVDSLESPGMNTTTTVSESFDLHEFSYITAFTTPPSSPSIDLLDAQTFKKEACLGDSKHAV